LKELLEILKDLIPIPIILGFAAFIYFLIVFKRLADEFLKISKAREERAEKEVEFLEKRFSVVGSEVELLEKITLVKTEKINSLIEERNKLISDLENKESEIVKIENQKEKEKKKALKSVTKKLSYQVKGLDTAYMIMDKSNMARLPFVSLNLARELSQSKNIAYYAKMDVYEFSRFVGEYGIKG
jgi:phosphoenolpyruvate-protein kinase (PTS system EI component)